MEKKAGIRCGSIVLDGLIALPQTGAGPGAVVCHPHPLYGGCMHNNVVEAILAAYWRAGWATLRFDFRGTGSSGGVHGHGVAELDDVAAAVGHLAAEAGPGGMEVAGYSFGAAVGLRAGMDDPRVTALVGVALPVGMMDCSFLESCAKPCLLLAGDSDEYCPRADLEALAGRVPGPCEVEILGGANHFLGGREREIEDAVAGRFLRTGRPGG